MRHPGNNLFLGQALGQRNLDRAIKRQGALEYFSQRGQRRLEGHVAAQDRAAEALARDFDLFGQGDFFGPGQERNLGHLAEIHADRIAAEFGLFAGQGDDLGGGRGIVVLDLRAGKFLLFLLGGIVELGLRPMVDQIDAFFFQGDQEIIEPFRIDFFVGQIVVDFVVRQIALGFSLGDKFLQVLIEEIHFLQLLSRPCDALGGKGCDNIFPP